MSHFSAPPHRRLPSSLCISICALSLSLPCGVAPSLYPSLLNAIGSPQTKDKPIQRVETILKERLTKDDLRVEAVLGSYKFTSQVIRVLLGKLTHPPLAFGHPTLLLTLQTDIGPEHKEIEEVFD